MSNDTFKNNPDLQEYFETADGTAFYKADLAKNHAKTLKDPSVKTVSRPEEKSSKEKTAKAETKNSDQKETFADIIAKAPEMDLETVTEYLEAENKLPSPRKTVLEALTAQLDELQK